jgi:hypothetical protein
VYKLEYDTADTTRNAQAATRNPQLAAPIEVTVSVSISNDAKAIGDSGEYNTLILTVCWKS